jgi:hypothetical protein
MAIIRKQVTAARESTSLHFPNESTKAPEDSKFEVENNYTPDTLIDPEDNEGGDTHFLNEREYNSETNKIHAAPQVDEHKPAGKVIQTETEHKGAVPLAPVKGPHHPAKTSAAADEFPVAKPGVDEAKGPNANQTFKAGGPDSGTGKTTAAQRLAASEGEEKDCENGQQATQYMTNFENPTSGYIETKEEGLQAGRGDSGSVPKGDTVEANAPGAPELPMGNAPQQEPEIPAVASGAPGVPGVTPAIVIELPQGNAPQQDMALPMGNAPAAPAPAAPMPAADDFGAASPAPGADIGAFDDAAGPTEDPMAESIEEPAGPADDQMSVLDVDGADDEADDVVFANVGSSVKVIKANRIIASMNKVVAAKNGHEDMYMSEQFATVTEIEMAKHGVRAGLAKMGFVLATVNMGKAEVLNKRVEAKAQKLTAGVRAEAEAQFDVLEQALAIAAVGINKGFFKNQTNELRAALDTELSAAGVRGHKKMLASVFATKGIDFAKAILTVAKQVSLMPEETRANFVAALDMVGDEGMFGDSSSPDFQSQITAGNEESDEFAEDVYDNGASPSSVHAALLRPATNIRSRSEVSAKATNYSVSAAAILSGKAPLPFA